MSADLYIDLTIAFPSKNYPKRTPQMSKSLHWIKSYVGFNFWDEGGARFPDYRIVGGGRFADDYRIVRRREGGAWINNIGVYKNRQKVAPILNSVTCV